MTRLSAPVERGKLFTTIRAAGPLKVAPTVKVGSQLSGRVSKPFADFNDVIKKGQSIAQRDLRTLEARVREAKAAVGRGPRVNFFSLS